MTRKTPAVAVACPRCGTGKANTTLLTSMVRYYACARCGYSWTERVATSVWPGAVGAAHRLLGLVPRVERRVQFETANGGGKA